VDVIDRFYQRMSAAAVDLCLEGEKGGERPADLQQTIREMFYAMRAPLYRYLLGVVNNPLDAEDLTQETLIRLFQHLRKGKAVENPRAWLFRVAHNLAVDFRRSANRSQESSSAGADELGELRQDPSPDIEQQILEQERLDHILRRLSPLERRCMELRTEGLYYREIAEVLGIRVPTVQTVLGRAIRKLIGSHE
jgi:RNA polymerase sigma-70 factor (ECF subfamily)